MKSNTYKIATILVFAAANIMLFQNCDKKMKFSTASDSATNGNFDVGEGDGDGGNYDPGEGDGSTGGTGSNGSTGNIGDTGGNGTTTPPPCTETFDEIQLPVKVLFVVDMSGSNADNTNTTVSGDGTDVNKNWRTNILNQLRSANNSSYFKYNYVLFRGNDDNPNDCNRFGNCGVDSKTTSVLMNDFTNDNAAISTALTAFANEPDKGKTPYRGALTRAKELIQADINAHPSDTQTRYSVIMVTDGHPDLNLATKPGGNPNSGADVDLPASINIANGLVSNIVNISDRVNVNTIYYYKPDQYSSTAVSLLSAMATTGDGVFIKADTGTATIDLKHTIRVPKTTCSN